MKENKPIELSDILLDSNTELKGDMRRIIWSHAKSKGFTSFDSSHMYKEDGSKTQVIYYGDTVADCEYVELDTISVHRDLEIHRKSEDMKKKPYDTFSIVFDTCRGGVEGGALGMAISNYDVLSSTLMTIGGALMRGYNSFKQMKNEQIKSTKMKQVIFDKEDSFKKGTEVVEYLLR